MFYSKTTVKFKIFFRNGRWCVTSGPVSPDPGRDEDPARGPGEPGGSPSGGSGPGAGGTPDEFPGVGWRELPPSREDWLTEEQWVAWLSSIEPEDPPAEDPEDDPGLDDPAQPGTARPRSRGSGGSRGAKGTRAGNRARAGKEARAGNRARAAKGAGAGKGARAVKGTRRGPGQRGSARRVPGESPGPVGAFGTGQLLDTAPGGPVVFGQAVHAAGDGARFAAATEDELTGIICGLDRAEAAACALKHAAVAELIRRRPEPGCEPVLAEPGRLAGGQAPAPGPDPARYLRRADVPAACSAVRLRA